MPHWAVMLLMREGVHAKGMRVLHPSNQQPCWCKAEGQLCCSPAGPTCSTVQKGLCSAMEIGPGWRLTGPRAMSLPFFLLAGMVTKQEGSLSKCSRAVGLLKCSCEFRRRILKDFSYFAYRVYCLLNLQSENNDTSLASGDTDVS